MRKQKRSMARGEQDEPQVSDAADVGSTPEQPSAEGAANPGAAEPTPTGGRPASAPLQDLPRDARELSVEETIRLLRAQMADPDWRSKERHVALRLSVPEDPAAEDFPELAFGAVAHPERTMREWRRAQALVDASIDGRELRAEVELVPGAGAWHAWLHIPMFGGGLVLEERGFRTPLAALRRVARRYLAAVVEDGARTLEARGRRDAAVQVSAEPAAREESEDVTRA